MSMQKSVLIWWAGCITGAGIILGINWKWLLFVFIPISFVLLVTEPLKEKEK